MSTSNALRRSHYGYAEISGLRFLVHTILLSRKENRADIYIKFCPSLLHLQEVT